MKRRRGTKRGIPGQKQYYFSCSLHYHPPVPRGPFYFTSIIEMYTYLRWTIIWRPAQAKPGATRNIVAALHQGPHYEPRVSERS